MKKNYGIIGFYVSYRFTRNVFEENSVFNPLQKEYFEDKGSMYKICYYNYKT